MVAGWYVGDIPTPDRVARMLANAPGLKALLVEYRLAPEYHWPGRSATPTRWWGGRGLRRAPSSWDRPGVVLGGDSAGGWRPRRATAP